MEPAGLKDIFREKVRNDRFLRIFWYRMILKLGYQTGESAQENVNFDEFWTGWAILTCVLAKIVETIWIKTHFLMDLTDVKRSEISQWPQLEDNHRWLWLWSYYDNLYIYDYDYDCRSVVRQYPDEVYVNKRKILVISLVYGLNMVKW